MLLSSRIVVVLAAKATFLFVMSPFFFSCADLICSFIKTSFSCLNYCALRCEWGTALCSFPCEILR